VDRFHGRGHTHRKECRHGQLRPTSEPDLCGRNLERRLPSAARARGRAGVVRRWGRLGKHLRRPGGAEPLECVASAILNYPDYTASTFDPNSTAAKNIVVAGYPPDLVSGTTSFWGLYSAQFWEVTLCQWQKRLDPTYDTYGSGTGTYSYVARLSASDVGANLTDIATTGEIGKPLITVAGTMDALLPINLHARAYARAVAAAFSERGEEGDDQGRGHPAYRLYEVQNGNHIETYKDSFPQQLELIEPHAQRAFDLLVNSVEHGSDLPPDQCIPRGGSITSAPAEAGHCTDLFVP